MNIKQHLYNFLKLIPQDKVISYWTLANIFCVSPREIGIIISQNTEQSLYPCYKVINADGTIGWYNLWEEEKRKRLENDGIVFDNDRVSEDDFWRPRLRNIFAWFPLSEQETKKFEEVVNDIEQAVGRTELARAEVVFPQTTTPHVTLRFFWSIHIKDFQNYVYAIDDNKDLLQRFVPKYDLIFDVLDNFHEKVFFLDDTNEQHGKDLTKFYDEFHRILRQPGEDRWYHAHFTLYRMRDHQPEVQEKLADFIEGISFHLKVDKITWYAAVEQHLQVPLIDIKL